MLPASVAALLLLAIEATFLFGWLVFYRHWEREFMTERRRKELHAAKGSGRSGTTVSWVWAIVAVALFFGLPVLFIVDGFVANLGLLYAPSLSFLSPWDTFLQAAGLVLAILALILAHLAGRLLAEHVYGRAQEERRLIETGIFAYIRHPFYLSQILLAFGLLLLSLNYLALLLLPPVLFFTDSDLEVCGRRGRLTFLTKVMECEEQALRKWFGPKYDAYAASTGRLFPRIRR